MALLSSPLAPAHADPTLFPCGTGGSEMGHYQVVAGEIVGTDGHCGGVVSIDASVVSIAADAFVNTGATEINIPTSVVNIAEGAIHDNSLLTAIQVATSTDPYYDPLFVSDQGVLYSRQFYPTSGGRAAYTTYGLLAYPTAKASSSYTALSETVYVGKNSLWNVPSLESLNLYPYVQNISEQALSLPNLTSLRFLSDGNDSYLATFDFTKQALAGLENIYYCGLVTLITSLEGENLGRLHVRCEVSLPTISYPISAGSIPALNPMVTLRPTSGAGAIATFQISPDPADYGLSFNRLTGEFSGTPSSNFNLTFTIYAYNEAGVGTANIHLVSQSDVCYTTDLSGTLTGGPSCTGDLTIDPSAGITAIADYAFYFNHSSITSITIPDSVSSIGAWAFNNEPNLKTINFSGSYSGPIGGRFDTSSLEEINFASSNLNYTSIDGVVFNKAGDALIYYPQGRKSLSYVLPGGVLFILSGAFTGGNYLQQVSVPNSVIAIGDGAFQQNQSLRTVTLGTGVTDLGTSVFYNNFGAGLENVELTNSLRTIGEATFVGLKWQNVTIPEGVTSIGVRAFEGNTRLRSITLPSTLTSLSADAFNADTRLCQINYLGTEAGVLSVIASIPRHCPPGTPTIDSVTALSSSSVEVHFNPPADSGTSAIQSYTLVASNGSSQDFVATSGSPVVYSGLTADTDYTFQIAATNLDGTSDLSTPSPTAHTLEGPPATVPDAPTIGAIHKITDTSFSIDFIAPTSDGGSPINSYIATSTPGGFTGTIAGAGSGTIVVSGLLPSTSYRFSVVAINAIGNSAPSALSSWTKEQPRELVVAKLKSLTFEQATADNSGKLIWVGTNIDSVRFTGNPCIYPLPHKYGFDSGNWDGALINLVPGATYEVELKVLSVDNLGESKKLSFTAGGSALTVPPDVKIEGDLSCTKTSSGSQIITQGSTNSMLEMPTLITFNPLEISTLIHKFIQIFRLSSHFYDRVGYLTLPHSVVIPTSAVSNTPTVCTIEDGRIKKVSVGACGVDFIAFDNRGNKYILSRQITK
jgi:hypothetical protein